MKKLHAVVSFIVTFFLAGSVAAAHVTVKPADALTGTFMTFTMSVPNEKEIANTSLKLTIPEGLQFVTPTVKPGWNITTEKEGTGEDAKVKSITWAGGSIPSGFRDDFTFSGKTPDTATDLQWKAYQTYEDGTTVSWDQTGEAEEEGSNKGPLSITKVATKPAAETTTASSDKNNDGYLMGVSIAALVVSLGTLAYVTNDKKPASKKK